MHHTPTLPTMSRRYWLACSMVLALWGSTAHAQAQQPISVVASFSILGDLVHTIGGERVAVSTLVGADQDAHVFEPKPADAKKILASSVLVVNGLGFEPWAGKLARSAGFKGMTLVASSGITPLRNDPHAWQNPQHVVQYVRNIARGLSQIDPEGAPLYDTNAKAYIAQLQELDAWALAQFNSLAAHQRKVITSHDAFGYFAARYGIQFLAPQGINTDAQPSAQQMGRLVQQIKREKIRAIFLENMSNPTLLTQLSKDAGATVNNRLYADALSLPDQPGSTYLRMMRHNVTQLVAGMQLN
jgi:zinc/manganese transport system substrate-binding protein